VSGPPREPSGGGNRGRWWLGPDGDGYPAGLESLPGGDRPTLAGIGLERSVARLAPDAAVTIVGSRRATAYGLRVATEIAADLARAGVTVVSGMAIGIDAAAHRGALAGGGRTIAVLAGGADVVYPSRHGGLYREIVASGAAISEQRFGAVPRKQDFPARNRIMAALSKVVVVVEAARPSGTLITADRARELGRELGAVPGPVGTRTAAGANQLLKEAAHLIRDAQDVLDLLAGVGAVSIARTGPPLDPELDRALEAVERGATTADELARAAEIGGREAVIALTRLELLGYVTADLLGGYARTGLAPPTPE
jgi:DNA processing protein